MRRTTITLSVGGVRYELVTATWGDSTPSVVFVHDGLGSISLWRDVPEQAAARAGVSVLAYDRAGHGASTPVPSGAWPVDWMHREADVLAALIEAVAAQPVRLVGHSDGGTISLLCAAARPDLVDDVVALAPHSWVEAKCADAIAALRRDPDGLVAALGRHHAHPAAVFEAWSAAWTSPAFATWDVRPELSAIVAPVAVVQGVDDEYATEAMAHGTASAIGPGATAMLVPGCGHIVHRDRPDLVVALAAGAASAGDRPP